MAEAMHEHHPDIFKQPRKNDRCFVSKKEPRVRADISSDFKFMRLQSILEILMNTVE